MTGAPKQAPTSVKIVIIYVVDVQKIMTKCVYGLSGCHREGLVFLVQSSCCMWEVHKGGILRLGTRRWVTSRRSHLPFRRGLCCACGSVKSVISKVGLLWMR